MVFAYSSLLIAIGAMAVSGYYSLLWFIKKGMPVWIAIVISVIYVGFANMVFEYGVEFLKISRLWLAKARTLNKGISAHKTAMMHMRQNLYSATGTLTAWLLLAAYSMFCTVGGQYDQLMVEEQTQDIEEIALDYTESIVDREAQIRLIDTQIEQKLEVTGSVDDVQENWDFRGTTDRAEASIEDLRSDRQGLVEELETMRTKQQIKEYKAENGINTRGFYNYMSDILGGYDPLMIQFYSSLLPSVVIDLISPVALTIFMMWYKKRKKD